MRVWIANPFDNLPQEGFRPQRYWLMARAFVRAGHDVVCWSADFSHASKRPRDPSALEGSHEGIDLLLAHEPPYPTNVCLRRLWSHWRFARNWLGSARRELAGGRARPDVLIASSPPLALGAAARRLCRETGAKLVVDVQDAWPETFSRVVPAPLLTPLKRLAGRNYRAADAITAVSGSYLELVRGYGARCPMFLCPHGIDMGVKEARKGTEGGSDGTLRLAYVGNMSLSYDLATVVDAVKDMTDVTLDLAGSGPDETSLRARAEGCGRIRFHGYLPEDALRGLLSRADAGVIPMFDASLVELPGKLADYAAAGLPAINSLTGETAEILARHKAGVQYAAGDVASFRAAVEAVRHLEKNGMRELAVEFDAEKLYNSYAIFVEGIVGGGRLPQGDRNR